MVGTGFSPPHDMSPEGVTSSGSCTTLETPGKSSRSDVGAVLTVGRMPAACVVLRVRRYIEMTCEALETRGLRLLFQCLSFLSAQYVSETSRASPSLKDRQKEIVCEEEELELERPCHYQNGRRLLPCVVPAPKEIRACSR